MLLCLGDRGVGAAVLAEAMTAGVKRRFEDRLQDLEHRLLPHDVPGDLHYSEGLQLHIRQGQADCSGLAPMAALSTKCQLGSSVRGMATFDFSIVQRHDFECHG
jgi:hypothetical protein